MRKKIVAGNWKMNFTDFVCKEILGVEGVEIVLFMPFIHLAQNCNPYRREEVGVKLGAQNFYPAEKGAFTGEISASMIKETGATYVLIGHSERRSIFKETDKFINEKVKFALKEDLIPVFCVGETLEQREKNMTMEVISNQVKIGLKDISAQDTKRVIIAYEPVWAIGTGKTATKEQAEEVCSDIRDLICEMYNKDVSDDIRILYGGSVNGKNAKEIFSMPNIDGGLVGGASLTAEFDEVIEGAIQ
jgi:triosephosphate isomerase